MDFKILDIRLKRFGKLRARADYELLGRIAILDAPLFENNGAISLGQPGVKVHGKFYPHVRLPYEDHREVEVRLVEAYRELVASTEIETSSRADPDAEPGENAQ